MANFIEPDERLRNPIPTPRWQNVLVGGRQSFRNEPHYFTSAFNTAYMWPIAGAAVASYINGGMNADYLSDMDEHVIPRLTGLDVAGFSNRLRSFGLAPWQIQRLLMNLRTNWGLMVNDWIHYSFGITPRNIFEFQRLRWLGIRTHGPSNLVESD